MDAPLYPLGLLSDIAALILAVPLGAAFGILLERAGFANPRNVVGQFYGTDLRVLKMMFTALITAMIGLVGLAQMGWIDLSLLYVPATQITGNLLGGGFLGLGFIAAGYCPGTTVVGAASGRIDAWVCLLGLGLGVALFAGIDGSLGLGNGTRSLLPQALGLPMGWVVLAVALMAAGAFVVAELAEIRFGGKIRQKQNLLAGSDGQVARVIVVGLVLLAVVVAFASDPGRPARQTISAKNLAQTVTQAAPTTSVEELADGIMNGSWKTRLIEISSQSASRATSIVPGAEQRTLAEMGTLTCERGSKIVIIAEEYRDAYRAWVVLITRGVEQVTIIDGGITAWHERIVFPYILIGPRTPEDEHRVNRAKYFGGTPRITSQPMVTPPLQQNQQSPPVQTPVMPTVVPGKC